LPGLTDTLFPFPRAWSFLKRFKSPARLHSKRISVDNIIKFSYQILFFSTKALGASPFVEVSEAFVWFLTRRPLQILFENS
jgi:hypothetical protein